MNELSLEINSVYDGSGTLAEKLDRARTELLDLSARNRLLNMPKSAKGSKTIEIVDERSSEIFRLLVNEGKTFTFLPGLVSRKNSQSEATNSPEEIDEDVIKELALPDDELFDDRGIASRHSDTRLQTRFTPEGLQKRLLDLYYDARTLEDEQGVNVLYLALGALRWVDPNDKKNIRHAPLLLIPVVLERGTAGERFRLRARAEDYATNLSLENFLDRLHGIRLPETEISESFDLQSYFDGIALSVQGKKGWGVEADHLVLGFFSFAKFMMYRDLDASSWPNDAQITTKQLLKSLLAEGFETGPALHAENESIDTIIAPSDLHHILDSDSSQTLAVHEVRKGYNLVIQGPPGTGKSQTIANLISAAIADGKTVLFVAEKMAALEVVKRRLDATGIGGACLELHSHKANKKAVLEDIRRTWESGAPHTADIGMLNARLKEIRDELNSHPHLMHSVDTTSGLTPYQVLGQLVRLRAADEQPNDIELIAPHSWSQQDYAERHSILRDLVDRVRQIGNPASHIWYGAELDHITPMDVERLSERLAKIAAAGELLASASEKLAAFVRQSSPRSLGEIPPLVKVAQRIGTAPLEQGALASEAWQDPDKIQKLVIAGEKLKELRDLLDANLTDGAWSSNYTSSADALRCLNENAQNADLEDVAQIAQKLPKIIDASQNLSRCLGEDPPQTLSDILTLKWLAERVAAAPHAPATALSDPIWGTSPSLPADVLDALQKYQSIKSTLDGKFADAAWATDLIAARTVLATHGTGFFKVLEPIPIILAHSLRRRSMTCNHWVRPR